MVYSGPIMGFDTETTGVDVHSANTRVVSCAMIMQHRKDDEYKTLEWVMNPEMDVPTGASDIHGITTEIAVATGMDYRTGLQQIANTMKYVIMNSIPTTAYNGSFDASLLRNEFLRWSIDFDDNLWDNLLMIDPFVMDKQLAPFRKGKRTLGVVSKIYGYNLDNAHNATADVEATIHIARQIINKFVESVEKKYDTKVSGFEELMAIQTEFYKSQMLGLEAHFRKTDPSKTLNKSWPFQDKE